MGAGSGSLNSFVWQKEKFMKTYEYNLMNSAAIAAVLALGALGVNMPAHAAEVPAVTIWAGHERDALALEANADLHARIAEHDRGPCNGASKLRMTLWMNAGHYEWLAKTEREAARRVRNMVAMQPS